MNARGLTCSVCNIEFFTKATNARYCSEECRQEGTYTYQQRKEWESKTNYKEKQRESMRVYRNANTTKQQAIDLEVQRQREEERKEETARRSEERYSDLTEKAKQGDSLARMELAKPNSIEYWEAYKQYG